MRLINLTGKTFGRLLVLGRNGVDNTKHPVWSCLCECGTQRFVGGASLRNGSTKSCGCFRIEYSSKKKITHGHTVNYKRSRTYTTWKNLKARCEREDDPQFKHYGMRGIKVCERWQDFNNFLADMGEKPKGLTIDRKDNEKGYEPGNCQWATREMQNSNKRTNVYFTLSGITLTAAEWGRRLQISKETICSRKKAGHTVKAILRPFTLHG